MFVRNLVQAGLYVVVVCVGAGLIPFGCIFPQSRPITVNSQKPLKAEFESGNARVVEGRYLILPVQAEDRSSDGYFSSGSFSYSPSAWSGLWFGKRFAQENLLNLKIVDLQSRTSAAVFDHQVALGEWEESLHPDDPARLRFKDTLLLAARAQDTTGDSLIDTDDDAALYAFDLGGAGLRRLSPEGYSLDNVLVQHERIILLLRGEKPGRLHVFECDPLGDAGAFVSPGIAP